MRFSSFYNLASVQFLWSKYQSLGARDQFALRCLLLFFSLLLVVKVLMLPAFEISEKAVRQLEKNKADLAWMQSVSGRINSHKNRRPVGESLLGLASSSAKQFYINFNRYESLDDYSLRVNIESISFKNLILWLEFLDKNYGVNVDQIAVSQAVGGSLVDVRLVIKG